MYDKDFTVIPSETFPKRLEGPTLQMRDLSERMQVVNMIDDIAYACQLDCPNYFHCNSEPELKNLNWQAYARETFLNAVISVFTSRDYFGEKARYVLQVKGYKAGTKMCAITNPEVPLKHKEIRSIYFKERRKNINDEIEL